MLQQVCDEQEVDIFVSTYYTTPNETPSVCVAYDMIPELRGWDLNKPLIKDKHRSIENAAAYIAFSKNTAQDIVKNFPDISLDNVNIAEYGFDSSNFSVATQKEIDDFKTKYGISKPYFILVVGGSAYENSILFLQAFTNLASKNGFDIVCIGNDSAFERLLRNYTSGSSVYTLILEGRELATAYSAALALIYPSKYDYFILPVIEAMACGCPVISGENPAVYEVAKEAAIFINDDDLDGMINAICEVQKLAVRRSLIYSGLIQAKRFSWSKMADDISTSLIKATLFSLNLREINFIIFPDWLQLEETISLELERVIKAIATHPDSDRTTLLINITNISEEDAELLISSVAMTLMMKDGIDFADGLQISPLVQLADIQWQVLLPKITARIILESENTVIISQLSAHLLPCHHYNSFINQ
ncbi:glycosyltransferase [Cronbergia sp. UHCC 0137]|uniref:glycosyltransferase n=1 Tax=Cronbergia sp. UHCC 0137 TaxID=3110239 RepID=UPI002B1FE495|nr:glycosyltransferase [Cronbergia sp. UHCC 0137]MEA5616586.1 glycosyltransferase [Cronbergia sp. UHCC 0137]